MTVEPGLTRRILDPGAAPAPDDSGPLLAVRELTKRFPLRQGVFLRREVGTVHALSGVSFEIRPGETLGLVGESGCGKSTLSRCILRLIEPTSGRVWFRAGPGDEPEPDGPADGAHGGDEAGMIDVLAARPAQLRRLRKRMQVVFQDPFASLDPRMTVERTVAEPLDVHSVGTRKDRVERVADLLRLVGLNPEHAGRYPHEFSGGQRQRIGIARALALEPSLLILDEPVSSLDVSIQAQIINLLNDLQDRLGLAYLFIAHDLSVVRHISHRVGAMYLGEVVELGDADKVYERPFHPYTAALLAAVPVPDPAIERGRPRTLVSGELPSAANLPSGCVFHTRCPIAQLPSPCADTHPELRELEPGRWVRCHFAEQLRDA